MIIPTRLILTAGIHTLGVGAAGHAGADAVLDGDSLHGRGLTQGDGLFVLQALVGRRRAVNGVDLEPLWSMSRLSEWRAMRASTIPSVSDFEHRSRGGFYAGLPMIIGCDRF